MYLYISLQIERFLAYFQMRHVSTCLRQLPRYARNDVFSIQIRSYSASSLCSRHRWQTHHRGTLCTRQRLRAQIEELARSRRRFSSSPGKWHGHLDPPKPGEECVLGTTLRLSQNPMAELQDRLHVTFIDKEGDRHTFKVAKGDNLLDIAQANDLEMEGKSSPSPRLWLRRPPFPARH